MNNNEVISILNDLIETCKDGQKGFGNAAENIRNIEFRRLFNMFSQQCGQFVSELQAEVHRLGVRADDSGSVAGPLPRGLSNVRSMTPRTVNEAAIIAECQRGEETAVNAYQEALKADLPLD